MKTTKTIRVNALARVEGEGSLYVRTKNGKVEEARLNIFEPPRFFEALLRGRCFTEAPDITSRICGICPVAYQMSAVHAMEQGLGVRVSREIRQLRRLLYCGEWIESHALHVYMLHAPDFLGYPDAIRMAKDHPEAIKRGLSIKKAGNELMRVIGGREIHPINVRVGGFYKAPAKSALLRLLDPLKEARDQALAGLRWVAAFPVPDFRRKYEFVALHHPREYAMNEGRIRSSAGFEAEVTAYDLHFTERQIEGSNALYSRLEDREYLTGPLARYNLSFDLLSPLTQEAAASIGFSRVCENPFQSAVIRSLEILHALDEAISLLNAYEEFHPASESAEPRPMTGYACTEAPRGLLYHRYRIGAGGIIDDAKIVPPTSQNQAAMESDLRGIVEDNLELSQGALTQRCEAAIRNHDPCISCAAHFLNLEVRRA